MKNYFLAFLFAFQLLSAQNGKSKFYYYNEDVTMKLGRTIQISNEISSKKNILKTNERSNLVEEIGYNNFNEISNIEASTYSYKDQRTTYLRNSDITTKDVFLDNIFHSDYKEKSFLYPDITDNSDVALKYKKTYTEIKLLDAFYFQKNIDCQSSKLTITFDNDIEIGYKLFGINIDAVKFSEVSNGKSKTYTWEMKDSPEFKGEEDMPAPNYVVPHIIYYVKNYTVNGTKTNVLENIGDLYKWYSSLVQKINKTNQDDLKAKTLELIKNEKNDMAKAKIIFDWVQNNLNYVAFEDGMGGFIPREAALIYTRKYGDCKDMANILNEMLKYAGLKSNLTWIGTRHKNYSYYDIPSPAVDNHMITCLEIDGKKIFLDATGKYSQFPMPTTMIQGKEALIYGDESNYSIEKVPVIDKTQNKIEIDTKFNISENAIVGNAKANFYGFNKTFIAGMIGNNYQREKDIWKRFLIASNLKIQLEIKETELKPYEAGCAKANFDLKLDNWVKKIGDQLIVKPILFFPLKDDLIDIEKRKYPVKEEFMMLYEIKYTLEIPNGYTADFIPKNNQFTNDLGEFKITYLNEKNIIYVTQNVSLNTLFIQKSDFEKWNLFISSLVNQYNQSVILKKV